MPPYSEADLSLALEAIANGQSVRKAAIDWGIPRSTLRSRILGHESHRQAAEDQQRLSPVQEGHLASWIITQEALGLPPTHAQVKEFAQRILAAKGDHRPIGKHWMAAFLKRNPSIKTKRHRTIDAKRVNGATTPIIKGWFPNLYLPVIEAIEPEHRHNMDEGGIMEGHGVNGLVLGSAETQAIQKKQPGESAWTSFIECISATGKALPPLVIFKGKTVQQQWFPDDLSEFKDWKFTATENGWTTEDTAVEWLKKVFIPMTATPKTRLLILDGHGSHTTTDFMWLCYINNIHLLFLPPHTSHVLQPLDLGVFSSLKHNYRKQVGYLNLLTDSSPLGKRNFLISYNKARKQALTIKNIQSGWKATGLWPRSLSKPLLSPLLLENSNKKKETPKQTKKRQFGSFPIDWSTETSIVSWSTPRKSKELQEQVKTFIKLDEQHQTTQRQLFRKISKGYEEKEALLASAELKIQALEVMLEAARPKKRRKVKTSPNSKFANIEEIHKAQQEAAGIQVEEISSDSSSESSSAEDCIQVQC